VNAVPGGVGLSSAGPNSKRGTGTGARWGQAVATVLDHTGESREIRLGAKGVPPLVNPGATVRIAPRQLRVFARRA